ncbi:MAG: N-acetylmuramoyl-L-alanine amidase [Balneolaceae bacterium]|nr:MAG: N-acetylmuramoyl-L-alanine amidase [Balneolaceae bacterium]
MKQFSLILIALLLAGCTDTPDVEELVEKRLLFLYNNQEAKKMVGNKPLVQAPSLNFNLRNPSYIILHHTEEPDCESALQKLTHPATRVSAHYLICKDGSIYQIIDDHKRAWHAGSSRWGTITDVNSVSLGIELDNFGSEPFPEIQVESLIVLLKNLQERYNILPTNILGHGDIAPGRKKDPHCLFPWQKLAEEGLAIMPDSVHFKEIPDDFDYLTALQFIGYDTRNPDDVIEAFRRRYIGCKTQESSTLTLYESELEILMNILYNHQKY